jgi:hypothetical protein
VEAKSNQMKVRSNQVEARDSQVRSRGTGEARVNRMKAGDVNAKVKTVLSSITASSDTVDSKGRQMKQC